MKSFFFWQLFEIYGASNVCVPRFNFVGYPPGEKTSLNIFSVEIDISNFKSELYVFEEA